MYKVVIFIPLSHVAAVKSAIFAAGAGRMLGYDQCCWTVEGEGQFRPCQGANPTLGSVGVVETVREVRLETVCEDNVVEAVIAAIRSSHPYEVPAFDVWKTENTLRV